VGGELGHGSVLGLETTDWHQRDARGRTMGGREEDSRVGGAVVAMK
jgi:hypothetical protein